MDVSGQFLKSEHIKEFIIILTVPLKISTIQKIKLEVGVYKVGICLFPRFNFAERTVCTLAIVEMEITMERVP